jgi:hypothetical protein
MLLAILVVDSEVHHKMQRDKKTLLPGVGTEKVTTTDVWSGGCSDTVDVE